ncbi:hypothetical protein [Magnetospirillum molischianum]|uniref:Uncharacterized protein n=1 Tax=Magnetospirillum molischianum DSM 120 TaxID=1150626 RepID=H8FY86_MAGML|nr:hypothetical protein [Magnetospirillum molischianum]CCG43324.1 hypothetical protein PHAMO_80115 [Magnetospirillum molischianum DSM 120]
MTNITHAAAADFTPPAPLAISEARFCQLFDELLEVRKLVSGGLCVHSGLHPEHGKLILVSTSMGDFASLADRLVS